MDCVFFFFQHLPHVAKLFVPSVRCPTCSHANDADFRFCQRCGYKRRLVTGAQSSPMDVHALRQIDERLRQLTLLSQATSYSKQKDSLQKELETFLCTLPGSPSLANVTPRDLCRFLVFKDRHGKTQVHKTHCVHLGQKGTHECGCLFRLSHKTVDSYIGKLRSIFHAFGRDGEWDRRLCLGNPASDKSVKDYLRIFSMEQLQARVQPKQATPFLISKLDRLVTHITECMKSPNITPTQRFILARNQAYFKAVFFSGDRPAGMGQVLVPEMTVSSLIMFGARR